MAVEITHIRLSGGQGHEHIVRYKWRATNDASDVGENDKPSMVEWVDKPTNRAYVGSGAQRVEVGVWRPNDRKPWLQTYADGKWTNNLLSLPHF